VVSALADGLPHAPKASVRVIDEAEREAWCACLIDDDDPDLDDRVAAEWAWLERWHPSTENVFALVSDEGRFLGKYDVPFAAPEIWRLWAPSVRGDQAGSALALLCRHLVAESGRRSVHRVEVILERTHHHFAAARGALLAEGFGQIGEKVIFALDLGGPLPEPVSAGLRLVPASTLPPEDFVRLCVDAGMWEPEAREVAPDSPAAANWIVALAGGQGIGVALLEDMDAEAGIVTCRHVGVRAEHRRVGYGRALLARALHAAREAGARRYVDSTDASNRPMRALFRSVGAREVGERLVFELCDPAARFAWGHHEEAPCIHLHRGTRTKPSLQLGSGPAHRGGRPP
jgi:GNAT superfamily N-acetyltransferase